VPVKISLGRRFFDALWCHFRGIRLSGNTTWPELLALKVVLRERGLDAVRCDGPVEGSAV
jgi:hypothetical protein